MPVVVSSVTLMIVWSLQLLQCVPVVRTDRPGTPAVVAVHSAWADGPSAELQMPNNQIPVDLSSTVKGSADVATMGFYPVLTTGSPLSVGQIEHTIGKPYYLYVDGRDYHRETDTGHPEYSTDHGSNVDPRWNRYERVLLSALSYTCGCSFIGARTEVTAERHRRLPCFSFPERSFSNNVF